MLLLSLQQGWMGSCHLSPLRRKEGGQRGAVFHLRPKGHVVSWQRDAWSPGEGRLGLLVKGHLVSW